MSRENKRARNSKRWSDALWGMGFLSPLEGEVGGLPDGWVKCVIKEERGGDSRVKML